MSDKNSVTLLAALTALPELRYTPNGHAVIELNLSGENPIYGKPGEFARFYDNVSFLGKVAEDLADTLVAGDVVLIEGRLDYQEWADKETGAKGKKLAIHGSKLFHPIGDYELASDQKGQPYLKGQGFVRVNATGTLGQDPRGAYTTNGSFVMSFSGAVSDSWKEGAAWKDKTNWVRVSSFDPTWENLIEGVKKGDRFCGEFDLRRGSYQDKDGVKQYTADLHPRSLTLSKRKKGGVATSKTTQSSSAPGYIPEEVAQSPDDGLPF